MLHGYDPLKENSQWRVTIALLMGELILVGIALSPFYNSVYFSTLKWHGVPYWLVSLMFVAWGVVILPWTYFFHRREILRRDTLRWTALKGSNPLRAPHQPSASFKYSLPLYIKREMKFLTLIVPTTFIFLACVIFILVALAAFDSSWRFPSFLVIGLYGVSAVIVFFPQYINPPIQNLITHHYLHPLLQIDEGGITAYYGRQAITMRWQDVRYFALTSSAALGKELLTANSFKREAYEICDGENIICWIGATLNEGYSWEDNVWLVEGINWPRSNTGPSEWDRQTEALPSLIAAKTGLPLYDLRLPAQKRASQLRERTISSTG